LDSFLILFESKYYYLGTIISHQFAESGNHRLIVDGEIGAEAEYEDLAIHGEYLGLSDDLSPTDIPIVLHLVGGQLDPL